MEDKVDENEYDWESSIPCIFFYELIKFLLEDLLREDLCLNSFLILVLKVLVNLFVMISNQNSLFRRPICGIVVPNSIDLNRCSEIQERSNIGNFACSNKLIFWSVQQLEIWIQSWIWDQALPGCLHFFLTCCLEIVDSKQLKEREATDKWFGWTTRCILNRCSLAKLCPVFHFSDVVFIFLDFQKKLFAY